MSSIDRCGRARSAFGRVNERRTMMFWIRRNGDLHSPYANASISRSSDNSAQLRPKRFVWRLWQSTSAKLLLEEAGRHIGMSDDRPPDVLFNSLGHIVTDPQQMLPGEVYALAWKGEEFDEVVFNDADLKVLDSTILRRRSSTPITHHISDSSAKQRRRGPKSYSDVYVLYAFLNGDGLAPHYFAFSQSQVEQGLDYLLGLMAKKFLIQPGKLLRMDGSRVKNVGELRCRGAYIICPPGQSYHNTWYFLPDHAIDTRYKANAQTVH